MTSDAWYSESGVDQDIVLSTKASLSRNLANFPFPSRLDDNESLRIQSIVFDAFNFFEDAGEYNAVSCDKLDDTGKKIMSERGIISPSPTSRQGIVLRNDGRVSCSVNCTDHVCVNSFVSGFDVDRAFTSVYGVDEKLQTHIQFAASHEFGYLNSSIMNCGSGLSLSACVHLPGLSLSGGIKNLAESLSPDFILASTYGAGGREVVPSFGTGGVSLGSFYNVIKVSCAGGSEFDNLAGMVCALQDVIKAEHNARKKILSSRLSEVMNFSRRALALANASCFVSLREAIEIVSGVKLAVDSGIFSGCDDAGLHALLYRIQEGHLQYVLGTGKFKFEKDIDSDIKKKTERLRALILQEAFENIKSNS